MSNIPGTPADGNVKRLIVPAIVLIGAPTVAELTGGTVKDYSCYLPAGGFNLPLSQAAISDDRECDTFTAELPGRKSISGSTITAIDNTGTANSASNIVADALVEGTTLYVVNRYGLATGTAVIAAQKVDVFKVIVGQKQRMQPEANSVFKSVWPLFVQDYRLDVAVAA